VSYIDAPTRTFPNNSAIAPHTRVKMSNGFLAPAGATDQDIGVLEFRTQASDAFGTVRLRSAAGTHKAIANAAIAAYTDTFTAASGKVGAGTTGAFYRGITVTAAGADGDIIEILPMFGDSAHA